VLFRSVAIAVAAAVPSGALGLVVSGVVGFSMAGTFALVERDTGNPLLVQNIDLATLTVNSHITGAVSFEVPVGATGGFVLKRSGLSPSEARKLADEQYRVFVASLLDLTDNLDASGQVVWLYETPIGLRDAVRLQPSGAYSANMLGLSQQVPMKVVFLTDGPSRHVKLGKQEIHLKRTTPRNMAAAGRVSGLVIQALRHLGQRHVDDAVIGALRARLGPDDKRQLLKDLRYAPVWIAKIMRQVAEEDVA
jgi:hypothetical protein